MAWMRSLRGRRRVLLALVVYALMVVLAPALHNHVAADAPADCVACAANPATGEAPQSATGALVDQDAGSPPTLLVETPARLVEIRLPARAPPSRG